MSNINDCAVFRSRPVEEKKACDWLRCFSSRGQWKNTHYSVFIWIHVHI